MDNEYKDNESVGYFKLKADEIDESQCRALWAAVLVQACVDARSKDRKCDHIRDRAAALAWLAQENENSDFALVCDLAGLEPSRIRPNLKKYLRKRGGLNFHCLRKRRSRRSPKKITKPTNKGEDYDKSTNQHDQSRKHSSCHLGK